uniref:Uncharacterized protein n=1 Tax=Rhabditophanes sp. KR3021 TaxID=114890 RepID=A0AC35U7Z1_9BILA
MAAPRNQFHLHSARTHRSSLKKLLIPNTSIQDHLLPTKNDTAKDLHSSGNEPQLTCGDALHRLIESTQVQKWNDFKQTESYLIGADLYTITILCLFASVILFLMIRTIKPSDCVDEQVSVMLNSMRKRVDDEQNRTDKKKLREAKKRIQHWLSDVTAKSVRKISFRRRSYSEQIGSEIRSALVTPTIPILISTTIESRKVSNTSTLCPRASTISGFVPTIVVTETSVHVDDDVISFTSSPINSRASSPVSCDNESQD